MFSSLILWYALTLGLSPNSNIVTYEAGRIPFLDQPTGFAELETEIRWGPLFLGGLVRTEVQKKQDVFSFLPELSTYGLQFGLRLGMGIEIEYLHICSHPIVPYFSNNHPTINWEGWYDEIHIRLSGESKLF